MNYRAANWIPASHGTEVPFITKSGARVCWMFDTVNGVHAYMDLDRDMVIDDEELDAYGLGAESVTDRYRRAYGV